MKKKLLAAIACCAAFTAATPAIAANDATNELVVPMEVLDVEKGNRDAGNVHIMMTEYGALFVAALNDVEPGVYGFHVHENGNCDAVEQDGKKVAGMAAGGHWDPDNTGQHRGPWSNDGHKGDLPALAIDADGNSYAVLAPRLQNLDELKGLSLMIHEGGDNYSDSPAPLGGGGARMICGVIE